MSSLECDTKGKMTKKNVQVALSYIGKKAKNAERRAYLSKEGFNHCDHFISYATVQETGP